MNSFSGGKFSPLSAFPLIKANHPDVAGRPHSNTSNYQVKPSVYL